jgi:hypothetical protein
LVTSPARLYSISVTASLAPWRTVDLVSQPRAKF